MSATLNRTPSTVRTFGDLVVSIESGKPWPGVYRGSKYSLRGNGSGIGLYPSHRDIEIEGAVPDGLMDALHDTGKSEGTGRGSIKITANRDVLTKVKAEEYSNLDEAFVERGWVPVYLGKLSGSIEFPNIDNDPDDGTFDPPCVWEGLPFNHGERWTMPVSGSPEWRKKMTQSFRFPSAYDHGSLTKTYRSFRPNGGRFRVNEHGHVWMELPNKDVQQSSLLGDKLESWYEESRSQGRNQVLQMIHRRLKSTGGGNPKNGWLPIYLGHISDFDRGDIPTPVINDETYFEYEAKKEDWF